MSASESDSSTEVSSEKHFRRKRTIIAPEQLLKLEVAFKSDPWPTRQRKEEIASELSKTEVFVSTWFQNKRARVRRTEDLHRTKPPAVKEDCIKTVSVEDTNGNKYLKIVRVSPSEVFGEHVSKKSQVLVESSKSIVLSKSTHVRALIMQEPHYTNTMDTTSTKTVSSGESYIESPSPKGGTISMPGGHPFKKTYRHVLPMSHATSSAPVINRRGTVLTKMATITNDSRPRANESLAVLIPQDEDRRIPAEEKPQCLFYSLVDMMAMAEGGIISALDPEYSAAVSNALYGIQINGNARIIYDKVSGLEVIDFKELYQHL